MPHDTDKLPEIPLAICPWCNDGFMAIKTVKPRLLRRRGIEVEFSCPRCEAIVISSVAPATRGGAEQPSPA